MNMLIRDKLISNTTYLLLDWFFISLISMLFWFIIGKNLLPSSYGIIATSFQIAQFLSTICLLGFGSAIRKLIPELLEKKQKNKIKGLILYSIKIVATFSLFVAMVLIIFSNQLSNILNLETRVISVTALLMVMITFTNFFGDIYNGFQKMKLYFLTDFLGQLTKIIVASFLIVMGFDYFGPIIALLLCFFITFISRVNKDFFKISKPIMPDKKRVFNYSIPGFLVAIFLIVFTQTQYIILNILNTPNTSIQNKLEITGFFAVALTVSLPIQVIPIILSAALFPITSGLSVDKSGKTKQNYLIKLIFRYSLFCILPAAIFLILNAKHVILFFSKPEYLSATTLLPYLVFASMFYGLGSLLLYNLYAIGEPKKYRDCHLIVTLVYLILAIPLTYYFSGIGLAISYLSSTFLLFILGIYLLKKYLAIRLPTSDIVRIVVGVLVSSLFLLLFRPYIPNFWLAGVFVTMAILIYLLILLKLNFYLEEDLKVLDFLGERSPILKKQIIWLKKYLSQFVTRSYH